MASVTLGGNRSRKNGMTRARHGSHGHGPKVADFAPKMARLKKCMLQSHPKMENTDNGNRAFTPISVVHAMTELGGFTE